MSGWHCKWSVPRADTHTHTVGLLVLLGAPLMSFSDMHLVHLECSVTHKLVRAVECTLNVDATTTALDDAVIIKHCCWFVLKSCSWSSFFQSFFSARWLSRLLDGVIFQRLLFRFGLLRQHFVVLTWAVICFDAVSYSILWWNTVSDSTPRRWSAHSTHWLVDRECCIANT